MVDMGPLCCQGNWDSGPEYMFAVRQASEVDLAPPVTDYIFEQVTLSFLVLVSLSVKWG